MPLLLSHQIRITVGPDKSRTTQPDPMTQALCQPLTLQIFSFVIGITAQPIEEIYVDRRRRCCGSVDGCDVGPKN
jgi:hypothetical protein